MKMTRNATVLAMLGIAFCPAGPAQAAKSKIESFTIKQGVKGNQLPEYHLVWQDQGSRWVPRPDDEVLVSFEHGVTMDDSQTLTRGAMISVKFDNLETEVPLKLSGDGQRQSGRIELRRAGSAFNAIRNEALRTCQKIRRDSGQHPKVQRFAKQFPVTAQVTESTGVPGSTKPIATARTTVRIVIVCHAG